MSKNYDSEIIEHSLSLHKTFPVIDLHADTFSVIESHREFLDGDLRRHLDLPRMEKSGIDAEIFSIFVYPNGEEPSRWLIRAREILSRITDAQEQSEGRFGIATSVGDISRNIVEGVISGVIEIEGLHPLGGNIGLLGEFYRCGVRVFTLTWNNSNAWAVSCMDDFSEIHGLTDEGFCAVSEINRLGGVIDLSHSGVKTFWDVIDKSKTAPVCSHSCCKEIKDSSRNLDDDQVIAMIDRGGIIGVNFFPGFLSSKKYSKTTPADIVDHIEYIFDMGGEDNVGLGSDFDGVQCLPGMRDCSDIYLVTCEMLKRGYSDYVIEKAVSYTHLTLPTN